jgi:hypothetical protein
MVESRYEKYIIRKAAVITENGQEVVPDRILGGRADTGPIVMCSPNLMKGTDQLLSMVSYRETSLREAARVISCEVKTTAM